MTLPRDPRVKLIMSYDIPPDVQQAYYEFVLREFIPQVQELGLAITEAWHTAYGDYPARMTTFVAPDLQSMRDVLDSEEWGRLTQQLEKFVTNPHYKIVPYKEGFQF